MMNAQRIRQLWEEIEEMEPDISTERLIAMVRDRAWIEGSKLDASDVCEAMLQTRPPLSRIQIDT